MKTQKKEKRNYIAPLIEQIQLDNEISLALESTPPMGPNELTVVGNEHFNKSPFHSLNT